MSLPLPIGRAGGIGAATTRRFLDPCFLTTCRSGSDAAAGPR